MKCVAYARVSTDSKDQENSYENQRSYFDNKLSNLEGHEFCGIYADKGLTGTKLDNRPEFKKMLQDAGIDITEAFTGKDKRKKKKHILYEESDKEPKFNEIWIKNTSRFARNTLSFDIIQKLRNKGVHIYFVEQSLNTKDIGSDFLLKLFQLFDEQESRDKGIKVSTGIKEGARKGVISTNSKIFGYNYIQHENRLEIIPEEAEVIRLIFNLYSQGYGIRRIINHLDERVIKTRNGKSFVKNSIKRILTNEKYAGINIRMKYTTGTVFNKESYPKLRPEDERIEVETDKIPAIVSKQLFDRCQEILKAKVNHENQVGIYKGTTEYAGLLVCGKCGKPYISNVDRGRKFYNCSTKKQHGTKACDNKNISLSTLDLYDSKMHVEFKEGHKKTGVTILGVLIKRCKEQLNNPDFGKIAELQEQIQTAKDEIKKLALLFMKGKLEEDIYDDLSKPYKDEIKRLELKLEGLQAPKEEILDEINKLTESIEKLKSEEIKDNYSREEILSDIQKIVIQPDNSFTVNLKLPYNVPNLASDYYHIKICYSSEREFSKNTNGGKVKIEVGGKEVFNGSYRDLLNAG